MNSITHAYSVVAFLLVLGCALIGSTMSVFSNIAIASTTPATDASSTLATTTVTQASTTAVSLSAASSSEVAIEATNTSEETITDNYPREKLADDTVYHDFVVGPGRFEMQLAPGQSKTVELVITNRMGERKLFSITTEDTAGSADGSESIVLLGDQKGPYTLKDYIKVPYTKFYLNQGERVRVPVTVTMPKDAEPGGKYGSLLVSIVSDPIKQNDETGAKPGSAIISRIGTLFFITTPGALDQEGKLKQFSTVGNHWLFNSGPISFSIVSENTGTVHLTPSGEVDIYNMLGSQVGAVQLDPWFVMPKSLRVRELTWNRSFLMGRYTAVAKINRGYGSTTDQMSYSFWIVPWKLLAAVFVGFFLFFLLLRFIFSQFEFKKKSK